ncbi:acyl-carrier-protein s-malonyltransferase [Novosphingobium sp. Rr 2-17]|uniref:acyltransferase domain-containing protein n=1 Tax=Novosphingobium sp. Rr 2-17 TaxID=555793 RepID=UPI00026998E2|nr:acyltransferase domain-containing protein [Novosphingobium sp. Rr 2-17]EIZ77396.1 acyl-carrier-protein s-malonyltransferase [Novosphingobium sp. Rr 2-17]
MTLALLCSGQGRQSRDMLAVIAGEACAKPVLDKASELLGKDIAAFLADEPNDALYANRASQILCTAQSLATCAAIFPDGPPSGTIVTGYSVGEVAAWGVAGVWSATETLDMVDRRAKAMDAVSGPDDGLCFVRALSRKQVDALARNHDCDVAIINPDDLLIVGGAHPNLVSLCEAALAQGAQRADLMPVHVASHTPRLAKAVEDVLAAFNSRPPGRPRLKLMETNSQTLVREPAHALPNLAAQIAHPIDWKATLAALQERGVSHVLELGPGAALADMAMGSFPDAAVRSASAFRTIEGIQHWLAS